MMVKRPGRQATKLEQLLYAPLIPKRSTDEVIIIHHITENVAYKAQLEIERYCPINGYKGERVYL